MSCLDSKFASLCCCFFLSQQANPGTTHSRSCSDFSDFNAQVFSRNTVVEPTPWTTFSRALRDLFCVTFYCLVSGLCQRRVAPTQWGFASRSRGATTPNDTWSTSVPACHFCASRKLRILLRMGFCTAVQCVKVLLKSSVLVQHAAQSLCASSCATFLGPEVPSVCPSHWQCNCLGDSARSPTPTSRRVWHTNTPRPQKNRAFLCRCRSLEYTSSRRQNRFDSNRPSPQITENTGRGRTETKSIHFEAIRLRVGRARA